MSLSVGKVSSTLFHKWNLKKALSYMAYLKKSSPQHSFRFSDQAWLRQDRTADHVLRRLHERWVQFNLLSLRGWNWWTNFVESSKVTRYTVLLL